MLTALVLRPILAFAARFAGQLSARAFWLTGFVVAIASSLAICLWVGFSSFSLTISNAFGLISIVGIATACTRRTLLSFVRLSNSSTPLRYMQSGAAYAKQLVVLTGWAVMVIGAFLTTSGTAFAGDAGLAASSDSSYGLFALVGVIVLALAGLAKLGFTRRS